jgi:hypothetical protein
VLWRCQNAGSHQNDSTGHDGLGELKPLPRLPLALEPEEIFATDTMRKENRVSPASVIHFTATQFNSLQRNSNITAIEFQQLQTHCSAIQTLLQANSNNYKSCAFLSYFALAAIRGNSR